MYRSATSTRLSRGRSTPEIRATPDPPVQPCLCLWRGLLEQMTRMRPRRLMILHRSHIRLTDGPTFIRSKLLFIIEGFAGLPSRPVATRGQLLPRTPFIIEGFAGLPSRPVATRGQLLPRTPFIIEGFAGLPSRPVATRGQLLPRPPFIIAGFAGLPSRPVPTRAQ